jgi:hypothetical protein
MKEYKIGITTGPFRMELFEGARQLGYLWIDDNHLKHGPLEPTNFDRTEIAVLEYGNQPIDVQISVWCACKILTDVYNFSTAYRHLDAFAAQVRKLFNGSGTIRLTEADVFGMILDGRQPDVSVDLARTEEKARTVLAKYSFTKGVPSIVDIRNVT